MTGFSKQQFNTDGYSVLPAVFSGDQLSTLKDCAAALVAGFDTDRHRSVFSTTDGDTGRDNYFFDSAENVHCFLESEALDADGHLLVPPAQAINKIGHALHDHVPEFAAFCRQPLLAEVLTTLGMQAPLLWQTMYIFKQPRIGGVVRWHQDASYLRTEPASVVGMWVALEDAHQGNGCLWMAPGAHRRALREVYEVDWVQRQGALRQLGEQPWPGEQEAVAVEVPAGSLVLFHDHMPHYSSPNRSAVSRQALTLHFAPAAAHWSASNWLQRPTLPPFAIQA